jgi:hypothetical protein
VKNYDHLQYSNFRLGLTKIRVLVLRSRVFISSFFIVEVVMRKDNDHSLEISSQELNFIQRGLDELSLKKYAEPELRLFAKIMREFVHVVNMQRSLIDRVELKAIRKGLDK